MRQYCGYKGVLVGAHEAMMRPGEAPPTTQEIDSGQIRGCDRLRCRECGKEVVWFAARMWSPTLDEDEIARQYDQSDFAANLVVNKFSEKYRAYACRCRIRMQVGHAALDEMALDTDWPWACDGHAPPFGE